MQKLIQFPVEINSQIFFHDLSDKYLDFLSGRSPRELSQLFFSQCQLLFRRASRRQGVDIGSCLNLLRVLIVVAEKSKAGQRS